MAQALNNTNIFFSISPRAYSTLALNDGGYVYDVYGGNLDTYIHSANAPVTLQVWWQNTNLTQSQEGTGAGGIRVAGDLVNVIFDIYEGTTAIHSSVTTANDFKKICSIKKSKDIPKVWNGRPNEEPTLSGHRFTIDISDICADLLSYSLIPNNIGTWGGLNDGSTGPQGGTNASTQPNLYGGLNGQWVMEDIALTPNTTAASMYNLTANGAERRIRVRARFEVMKSDGTLEITDSPSDRKISDFVVINSAPQWSDRHNLKDRQLVYYAGTKRFLTNSPNDGTSTANVYFKKVSLDSQSEYLQWFQSSLGTGSAYKDGFALRVDYSPNKNFSSSNTVYLVDFMMGGRARITAGNNLHNTQYRQFAQNISPNWINLHNNGANIRSHSSAYVASPITATNKYYRVSVVSITTGSSSQVKLSRHMYYELDLEDKGNWSDVLGYENGVKFMWVNRLGGIDTYTAKRNISASVEVIQDIIKRRSPDRKFPNKAYGTVANSSIGANIYPHSREALNTNANRNLTVYTDPLTPIESTWLEEILTSPNVWVIQKTKGYDYLSSLGNTDEARPSELGYMPVLITNSSSVLVDEEEGLVQMNIEFSESHEINTQRN
jgi:hypothetical protein